MKPRTSEAEEDRIAIADIKARAARSIELLEEKLNRRGCGRHLDLSVSDKAPEERSGHERK